MKKILIIDDDSATAFPLQYYFRHNDFIADIAENAEEAIDMFKTAEPSYSILIIDIELRDNAGTTNKDKTGGIKVIKKVLEQDPDFKTKIIINSGKIDKNDDRWKKILNLGVAEKRIKLKPTAADTILNIIKEITEVNDK